jgi:hypothetical protein
MVEESEPVEPLDRARVSLLDPVEVAYWCREFGCTEAELEDAIEKVGTHTSAVREHFRSRR